MRLLSPCCALSSALLSLPHFVLSKSQVPLAAAIQEPLKDTAEPFSAAVASALTLTTTEHITSTEYNVVATVTMTWSQDLVSTPSRVDARHSERALVDMPAESQSSTTIYTLIQTITAESTTFTFACSIDPQCRATQASIAASKAAASESAAREGSVSPSTSSASTASASEPESSVSPPSLSSIGGSGLTHDSATVTATSSARTDVSSSSTNAVAPSNAVSSSTSDALPTVTLVTTVVSVSVLRVEETTYSIASTTTVTAVPSSTDATSAATRTRIAAGGGYSILALLLSILHMHV